MLAVCGRLALSTPDAARASPAPVPSTPAAPPVAPDGWPPRDAAGLPRMLLDYTHHARGPLFRNPIQLCWGIA